MKILEYLEKAWIVAAVCAFVVTIYNAITFRTFDYHIYFPLFCGCFCLLIFYNIRGQRRFREKIFGDKDPGQNKSNPKS